MKNIILITIFILIYSLSFSQLYLGISGSLSIPVKKQTNQNLFYKITQTQTSPPYNIDIEYDSLKVSLVQKKAFSIYSGFIIYKYLGIECTYTASINNLASNLSDKIISKTNLYFNNTWNDTIGISYRAKTSEYIIKSNYFSIGPRFFYTIKEKYKVSFMAAYLINFSKMYCTVDDNSQSNYFTSDGSPLLDINSTQYISYDEVYFLSKKKFNGGLYLNMLFSWKFYKSFELFTGINYTRTSFTPDVGKRKNIYFKTTYHGNTTENKPEPFDIDFSKEYTEYYNATQRPLVTYYLHSIDFSLGIKYSFENLFKKQQSEKL